jgi:hypothetical protein
LRRNDTKSPVQGTSQDQSTKSRHELLSTISLEPNAFKVLDVAGSWWIPWRELWPALTEQNGHVSLIDYVRSNLAEENLSSVASALICIAISLQHLRPGADDYDLALSGPPNELASSLLSSIDRLALGNDNNLECPAGIEALVLRAKSYVIVGNHPRNAWLMIRRAISVARLTERPRPDTLQQLSGEGDRRQRFLEALFENDSFMSLLLGLPSARDTTFNEQLASQVLRSSSDLTTQMRALRRIAAFGAGRVNDRNASTSESTGYEVNEIQQILDDAAGMLPNEWWKVETHAAGGEDVHLSHEHLLAQSWFYEVQTFLHLPLMLKPPTDGSDGARSRMICLNSSRNLLRIYHALRRPHLAPYTSKNVDFQALLAIILVMLGLLQHQSRGWDHDQCRDEVSEDVELIHTTRDVFELSSMEQGGSIARQGVHMIDSLGKFVADGERNDFVRTATLFIPFFGTVSVQSRQDELRKDSSTCNDDVASNLFSRQQDLADSFPVANRTTVSGSVLRDPKMTSFGSTAIDQHNAPRDLPGPSEPMPYATANTSDTQAPSSTFDSLACISDIPQLAAN